MAVNYLLQAMQIVMSPINFLTLIISVFFGLIVGMLPGLTSTMAVALLTGLTFSLSKETAIVSLIGVYVGSISGGCQSAILLNIPGTPASAATAMDGHPLSKQGNAGLAIFTATAASALGTIISVVCVLTLTPFLSGVGLKFQTYEFFLLALFGIVICGNLASNGDPLKGWMAGFMGLLVAQVGLDTVGAYSRFSFGVLNLKAGLQLIPMMIALFGFPEILRSFQKDEGNILEMTKMNIKEGLLLIKKNIATIVRSSLIGVFVGIVPGVGEDIGGWLSYWATKTLSKKPEKFGKGAYEGVISAESGNNACVGGAVIPVLSLAVPGSTSAAVLLAAFWLHGYRPGPLLMSETPEFLYQVAIYLFVSSIAMFFLALLVSKITVKILSLKKETLMPSIFVFCVLGSYVIRGSFFDIKVMFIFGIIGFLLSYAKFPAAPFLLGLVLGNMADSNLRRGLKLSDGSLLPYITRPICLFFVIVIACLILSQFGVFNKLKKRKYDHERTE